MTAKKLITTLVVALTTTLLAACGPSNSTETHPDRQLDLVIGDCSASFHDYSAAFVPEMVKVAESSALSHPRRKFWAGCFDGAPLRTLDWNPTVDFSDEPDELEDNQSLGDKVAIGRALGLKDSLTEMLRTPPKAKGSGQLEALELASQTPNVGRVFVFTDAVINEIEGVDLRNATPSEIESTVKLWAPRLAGLKGVDLTFVGVGRGAGHSTAVRNAQLLFTKLASAVGTSSFAWTLELPADFNTGGI